MDENYLQKLIENYLNNKEIWYFHIPKQLGQKRRQISGIFDLFCITYKKAFFVELKSPELKPRYWNVTAGQIKFQNMLDKNKIPNIISNNYKQIIRFIGKVLE